MTGRASLVVAVVVVAAGLAAWWVGAMVDRQAVRASADVVAQLAGDVQADFDPATLRPATNPAGSEYRVVDAEGALVTSSDLPLRFPAAAVQARGADQPHVEGYAVAARRVTDAEGREFGVEALTPTAPGRAAVRVARIAIALVGVLALLAITAQGRTVPGPSS